MDHPLLAQAESFLVLRLGAIGDVLRTLPAVRRLRKARPNAKIGWAIEDWAYPIIAGNPNVDSFHVLKRDRLQGVTALKELLRFSREVRQANYDVTLDFHGRFKSGLISLLTGAKIRIGFAKGQSTEHNHIFCNHHVHLADQYESRVCRFLHLLEPLNIDAGYDHFDHGIFIPQQVADWAANYYRQIGKPALAAYPGCSTRQASYHRWPAEKWIELLKEVGQQGIRTVLFWGPDEEELTQQIAEKAGDLCTLAPPTKLLEMLALLGHFRAFVGGNTAAMHMSWMQGVPTAVFVGPAQARTDAPLPPVANRVLRADDYAQPGKSKRCQSEVTKSVSVLEAKTAVMELLFDFETSAK